MLEIVTALPGRAGAIGQERGAAIGCYYRMHQILSPQRLVGDDYDRISGQDPCQGVAPSPPSTENGLKLPVNGPHAPLGPG